MNTDNEMRASREYPGILCISKLLPPLLPARQLSETRALSLATSGLALQRPWILHGNVVIRSTYQGILFSFQKQVVLLRSFMENWLESCFVIICHSISALMVPFIPID